MQERNILAKCFASSSPIWRDFTNLNSKLDVLFYPSAGRDFGPLGISELLRPSFHHIDPEEGSFEDPDLYVFSDFTPPTELRFTVKEELYSKELRSRDQISIQIDEICEITPRSEFFTYEPSRKYVDFDPTPFTGRAFFFKARITRSSTDDPAFRYAMYFCYDNINLLDQLFLKFKLPITHLVWKRDGSGLGGGSIHHSFLYPISDIANTRYWFIWSHYLDSSETVLNDQNAKLDNCPPEMSRYITDFSLRLVKKQSLNWDGDGLVNLYVRAEMGDALAQGSRRDRSEQDGIPR